MDLQAALGTYDHVALNLDKLDRVWEQMLALVASGPFLSSGVNRNEIGYQQLAESWTRIARSLPAIGGWRISANVIDYSDIWQARAYYYRTNDPQGSLAFEASVSAPATQSAIYRNKLLRARRLLVRQRAQELVSIIDNTLVAVPTSPDFLLDANATTVVVTIIGNALDEIERLLGDGLHGGHVTVTCGVICISESPTMHGISPSWTGLC